MQNKIWEFLKNKKIAILGFGKEGESTYNFIRRNSKQFLTIIDKNKIEIEDENVEVIYGDGYLNNLDNYDLIIKTPGISLKDINIDKVKDKIYSQLELLLMFNRKNVIGITGTKGKSTTSILIYNVLKEQNDNVILAGNIGIPVFDTLGEIDDETLLVIEMSSHQLEFLNISPHIGVILNLYEDHLDHAGSVKHYHECKMKMFDYQDSEDVAIYCSDNYNLYNIINSKNYKQKMFRVQFEYDKNATSLLDNKVVFNDCVLYVDDNKRHLLGNHNLLNIMVVVTICKLFNLDLKKAKETIDKFTGLENRLEYVDMVNEVKYYSDTIATIPEATISGIEAIHDVDTLIFGGMDRGINYDKLENYLLNSTISNLICMPTTGFDIGKKLEGRCNKKIIYVDTLDEAVKVSMEVTAKGKSCLLSPAAPSYTYFKNFMEKGNKYKVLIRNKKY